MHMKHLHHHQQRSGKLYEKEKYRDALTNGTLIHPPPATPQCASTPCQTPPYYKGMRPVDS